MPENKIVLYQSNELTSQLEVRVEDDTVWLTQAQMVELFNATKQNISLHINNLFKEKELVEDSVVKYSLTTASDGKKYNSKLYNLDVIISVGYRIKSKRGTQFRIWATKILKEFLLTGHANNQRLVNIENDITSIKTKVLEIDFKIQANLPPNEGIFYDGQVFDVWQFVSSIVKSAKSSIILIDNYIDESVLLLLSKRNLTVKATIYTQKISETLQKDLERHNTQYPKIELKTFTKAHDRFLIIDQKSIYHIGASLKDLGKKWFAFSKMELDITELIHKLKTN
ncbi:MAG: DNA-binding protein [Bacteroidetes bacterium GWF2_33_38]|nr:MAG: DNA-binding protein [Bacteroidetes bacterium GWF2_33_38]OFY73583.1 MAG: DNA-binding protein [Bacteroidetes bacterium RIFOXYA12_FULL_33_9]HBX50584.1 DNA-binding protein [Bacteroidales bacterium]